MCVVAMFGVEMLGKSSLGIGQRLGVASRLGLGEYVDRRDPTVAFELFEVVARHRHQGTTVISRSRTRET